MWMGMLLFLKYAATYWLIEGLILYALLLIRDVYEDRLLLVLLLPILHQKVKGACGLKKYFLK